jgi:SAM-dependent methyltransferase
MTIQVVTRYPIAETSVDHLRPRGTKNDNSVSPEFNRRLFALLRARTPVVLDLGCAGGGFVASLANAGAIAIGIEGSDYSRRAERAAWGSHGDILFTADIAKPFLVLSEGFLFSFNVVTMWEVLEHLSLDDLEALMVNIHAHTRREAFFIASVHTTQDHFEGVDYHATVRPAEWWAEFFESRGWIWRRNLHEQFDPHWVRGPNTDGPGSSCFVFEKP